MNTMDTLWITLEKHRPDLNVGDGVTITGVIKRVEHENQWQSGDYDEPTGTVVTHITMKPTGIVAGEAKTEE